MKKETGATLNWEAVGTMDCRKYQALGFSWAERYPELLPSLVYTYDTVHCTLTVRLETHENHEPFALDAQIAGAGVQGVSAENAPLFAEIFDKIIAQKCTHDDTFFRTFFSSYNQYKKVGTDGTYFEALEKNFNQLCGEIFSCCGRLLYMDSDRVKDILAERPIDADASFNGKLVDLASYKQEQALSTLNREFAVIAAGIIVNRADFPAFETLEVYKQDYVP